MKKVMGGLLEDERMRYAEGTKDISDNVIRDMYLGKPDYREDIDYSRNMKPGTPEDFEKRIYLLEKEIVSQFKEYHGAVEDGFEEQAAAKYDGIEEMMNQRLQLKDKYKKQFNSPKRTSNSIGGVSMLEDDNKVRIKYNQGTTETNKKITKFFRKYAITPHLMDVNFFEDPSFDKWVDASRAANKEGSPIPYVAPMVSDSLEALKVGYDSFLTEFENRQSSGTIKKGVGKMRRPQVEGGSIMDKPMIDDMPIDDMPMDDMPMDDMPMDDMPMDNMPMDNMPVYNEQTMRDSYFPEEQEQNMLPETPMESDETMEDKYLDFIIDEALDENEEDFLMETLQSNDRLSIIFDKVIDVAQEFAGSGPVEGPGSGVSDSIPARLSDGEFVFTSAAVEEIGADNLMAMMKDAEMKAEERQDLAEGGMPEERVELPVEEQKEPQVRIVKKTVDSSRGLLDEDEVSKGIKSKMMLDPDQRHVRS